MPAALPPPAAPPRELGQTQRVAAAVLGVVLTLSVLLLELTGAMELAAVLPVLAAVLPELAPAPVAWTWTIPGLRPP